MLIEHPHTGTSPYAYEGLWHYYDAQFDYVASATWKTWRDHNDIFNGPSRHQTLTKIISAESDNLEELKEWARTQLSNGADDVCFARTWPIPERHFHFYRKHLHGKRENGRLEVKLCPQKPS